MFNEVKIGGEKGVGRSGRIGEVVLWVKNLVVNWNLLLLFVFGKWYYWKINLYVKVFEGISL